MKFSEDKIGRGYFVTGYERNIIVVNGDAKTSSFIISDEQLIENWAPTHIDELRSHHLDPLLGLEPELVLIGTGEVLKFPSVSHYACLIQQNIGVEIMDSAAACRTYNILLNEGRKVVAGIILDPNG
ncbi:MAG: Xcc1710-like domain-containing protein [Gammaproteobacteria bacterium]|nr:Mth938-like domain-containing protein [Gammaproteobacteria bacterium]NNJ97605.1 Xcc1710-like domain-containing protein [Gammaproteobacteria bacterium]